jgi:dihydrofolate reductase
MRKLTAYLLISLDGVCEAPDTFARHELLPDIFQPLAATIAEQDEVLLGRRTYDDWSSYWPTSDVEPFASFINRVPKHVVSRTLKSTNWQNSSLLSEELENKINALKASEGSVIGVHGSIDLVQYLIKSQLLDELRLVTFPAIAGKGRRLFDGDGGPFHFDIAETQATPNGLNYAIYRRLS